MKQTLYLLISTLFLAVACTKEADMNMATEPEYTVQKNLCRVTKIEGHNEHWGDYTWLISYDKEKIEAAFRVDTEGDTIGNIQMYYYSAISHRTQINDFIPKIDADSIQRLDQFLENKYGAGNYSLKDSIPLEGMTLYDQSIDLYEDGRIKRQKVTHYSPRENVGVGDDFDNSYLLVDRTTNTYEYDENGRIIINRESYDVFDQEDPKGEKFDRTLHKYETMYDGSKITAIIHMTALAGENWTEQDRYTYNYSGNLLQAVNNEKRVLKFTYSGNTLMSVADGGTQYTYKFDGNGNVTEINDGQGNFMKMTYESGHGNFSVFTPILEQMLGKPFVK